MASRNMPEFARFGPFPGLDVMLASIYRTVENAPVWRLYGVRNGVFAVMSIVLEALMLYG